jgi:hypothetical protein
MSTLFLFVDESGNLDFSQKGTKYFVLTVLSVLNPLEIAVPLIKLKYNLMENNSCGTNFEEEGYFHASEDIQSVRDKVFDILSKINSGAQVDSIIAQKNKANPIFYRNHRDFYKLVAQPSLKYAITRASWKGYGKVIVIFSSIFDKQKRGILKQSFKSNLKQYAKVPFSIYFHNSKFDLCSQAVDYFGWAIYRKWEKGDIRSYNLIKPKVKTEFEIFKEGKKLFYSYI